MIPPFSSLDQDSGLELSVDVMQGPRRQPGPQPNHLTGGVHQPGAVDVTVEAEPVAPAVAVAPPASADQNDLFPGEDTGVGDDVTVEGQPVEPATAVAPPASADQNDLFPGDDTGVGDVMVAQGGVVGLNVYPNQSDPIWQLWFSAGGTIVSTAMTALTLPGNLRAVHTTDERARLIASVGVPIGVAAVSLVVSFCLPSDPVRRSNWITGLSWLNTFMLGGHIFYWVFP